MNILNPKDNQTPFPYNNSQQKIKINKFLETCIKKYTTYIHSKRMSEYEDELVSKTCEAFCNAVNADPTKCTLKYFFGIGKYKLLDKFKELKQNQEKEIIKFEAQLPKEYSFTDTYDILRDNSVSELEQEQEKLILLKLIDKIKNDILSKKELRILNLRFKRGLKFREIDTITKTKAGNSNTVYLRAIKKLRKKIAHKFTI